jgi:hypothetical protein
MNEDKKKLFSRLFVLREQFYLITGAFRAEFFSGQTTYVDGGQTVV